MTVRNDRGLSLIELLLVLVCIGVIAGVAIAQYASYRSRAFDSRVVAAVRHVAAGQEAYYASHLAYTASPASLEGVTVEDVTIQITAGNSGDLATSFRVLGSHPLAGQVFVWISDPSPGEPHLIAN